MAMVIAHAKQQSVIDLRDVIAGIYVANFDRLLRFWADAACLEDFVAEHCDWSEPRFMTFERWTYEHSHPPRQIPIPFTSMSFHLKSRKKLIGKMFTRAEDVKRVYTTAENISPNRVQSFGRIVPLITPELFLVAILRTEDVPLGKLLRESALRSELLQQVALQKLDEPEKMQF